MNPPAETEAVGLFSGGLDSALALRVIQERGVRVIAFNLRTPFAGGGKEGGAAVDALARELGVELVVEDAGPDYVEIIKNPRHGRGAALNPCVDCHIYMVRRARELMLARGASFCFTGEVLGQRPMSQRRGQLDIVAREAGLEGKLLRPLSAKLLPPTEAERDGLVDRERLLGLSGRSRKTQIAFAKEYGITGYASPAGGCLLTDRNFGARLADAFAHGEDSPGDFELLKIGRHFRLPSGAKAIVGRNEGENGAILEYLSGNAVALEIVGAASPVTLLRGGGEEDWPAAAALTLLYSDARARTEAEARVWSAAGELGTMTARAENGARAREWRPDGSPRTNA
jgi:tRNA-specific 2-thiouridylase